LAKVEGDVIDILTLKRANIIAAKAKTVKIFASGKIEKAVTVQGVRVTKGARAAIEAAGGTITE